MVSKGKGILMNLRTGHPGSVPTGQRQKQRQVTKGSVPARLPLFYDFNLLIGKPVPKSLHPTMCQTKHHRTGGLQGVTVKHLGSQLGPL